VSLTAIVEDLFPVHHGIGFRAMSYHPYVFFILCQTLLFSLLVQLKDVASMAPLLMFAQFAMTCALVLVVANGLVNPSVCDRDGATGVFCRVHVGSRWETYPIFVGIAVFAMEGIPTVLAIENSMARPERFEEVRRQP
jgi:amino acid permease